MKIKKWYLGIVGLLLLAVILSSLGLRAVAAILVGINPVYFFAALALELAGIFLKGLKYRFVVKAHNKKLLEKVSSKSLFSAPCWVQAEKSLGKKCFAKKVAINMPYMPQGYFCF